MSLIFGRGPGADDFFYDNLNVLNRTLNWPQQIIFNFGLLGGLMFFYIGYRTGVLCNKAGMKYLFSAATAYMAINSASGIVNYIYFYILFFFFLYEKSSWKNQKKSCEYG